MKDSLIEESSNFENKNDNNKKIILLINKLILIFIILDIISFLSLLFFFIKYKKNIFIISLILFLVFSISLIILIILKNKNEIKKNDESEELSFIENSEENNLCEETNIKETKLIEIQKDKKEKEIEKEKINEINERNINLRKGDYIQKEEKNDNLELVEKAGKLKSLSEEEIIKEKKKVQLLEDMNAMGTIMKEQILEEKKTNPKKFYTTKEIIQKKDEENNDIFALGIFSKALESQGMVTAIEKNNDEDSQKSAQTTLQFLVNGMSDKSKYNLHFDFGKEKNNKLLEDENERKKFHDKLREKLSKEYNINEEDIIITFPRRGSYQVTIIFKSQDFELNEEELIKKFQNEKDELSKLKKIKSGIILGGCILNPSMLDYRGNNKDGGWAEKGEKRGGEEYIPPTGWIGYGLKVMDVYENNTWLGMNNCEGEWCVAYHGVARGKSYKEVSEITGIIVERGFKPSTSGAATDNPDLRHPGKTCGLGVYCSPDIEYAEGYAGETELNNEKYKCVLMLRINPSKIRQSTSWPKEYILEPNTDEIRPYRILLKKVS